MRLAGKIGIVTAAASGMGRAGALRFAQEGAQVAVVDVDAAGVAQVVSEITAAGGAAHGIVADLTKDEESRRIVWDTVSRFKGLDFVWNHVGHPGPAAVEGIDMIAFDLAIDLNLRTVLVTTEAAIPEMRRARGRQPPLHRLDLGAARARRTAPSTRCASSGSSASCKSLAVRLAPEKIRVNAVCPGPIDTPMLRVFVARPDQKSTAGMDPEELVRQRAARLGAARPHRPARGDRQRGALPAVRRGVVRHGRGAAGRWRRDRGVRGRRRMRPTMRPRRAVVVLALAVLAACAAAITPTSAAGFLEGTHEGADFLIGRPFALERRPGPVRPRLRRRGRRPRERARLAAQQPSRGARLRVGRVRLSEPGLSARLVPGRHDCAALPLLHRPVRRPDGPVPGSSRRSAARRTGRRRRGAP